MEDSHSASDQDQRSSRAGEVLIDIEDARSPYTFVGRAITTPWRVFLSFRRRRIITVEPVMFVYMFGFFMFGFVHGQYIFNRIGRREYKEYSNHTGPFDFCITTKDLDELKDETGKKVEEISSIYGLVIGVAGQLPAISAALFYGPISDRIGRKPLILLIGSLGCFTGLFAMLIVYFNLHFAFFIPLVFFNAFGGTLSGIITATYSYMADVSSRKWLTLRLAILESMIFLGGTMSSSSTGVWLQRSGCDFNQPLLMYTACNAAIVLYTLVYLPTSMSLEERKKKLNRKRRNFKIIVQGFKILIFKQYSRWRLWFILISGMILYTDTYGAASVMTLFLMSKPLQWGVSRIGFYNSLYQGVQGITLLLILPVLVACRVPDALIALGGPLIMIVTAFLTGFVAETWQMFVIGVFMGLKAMSGPPLGSMISKTVSTQDQGAIFSVVAAAQVFCAIVATIIFSFFYPLILRLGWPSGTIYFLMAAIAIIPVPFIITLFVYRNQPGAVYEEITQENGTTEGYSRECDVSASQSERQALLNGGSSSDAYGTAHKRRDHGEHV